MKKPRSKPTLKNLLRALLQSLSDVLNGNINDYYPGEWGVYAACHGRTAELLAILERKADGISDEERRRLCLYKAAMNGHHETVSALLKIDADLQDNAFLDYAEQGHLDVARLLKEHQANIEDQEPLSPARIGE